MSNTTNTIIAAAVASVNEGLSKDLIAKATPIVTRINGVQLSIEDANKQIAAHRAELLKLAESKVDDSFLRGVADGQSKTTVLGVISAMNKDRQSQIEIAAKNITCAIDALQVRIKGYDEQVVELRKQLLAIEPRVVTAPVIVGS